MSIVLVATVGLTHCNGTTNSAGTVVPEASAAAPITSASANPAPGYFEVSGPIVVENQLDVVAQREGIVSSFHVDTGSPVRKGQLLANLDDRELRATRDAADAKLKSIEADVKNWEAETEVAKVDSQRAEKMFQHDLITREQLEHAKYKLVASQFEVEREKQNAKNALESLNALDLELAKTRVVAPFDGVVARRYVREGQRVGNGDRMFWVSATAPLRVRFSLPERLLGEVRRGQELPLTAAALPGEQFRAKVIQISPVVDPSSGTIEVLAELVQPVGHLTPGMAATLRIQEKK
jgi:membrane fusion protein (multidrug efflux system)